MKLILKDVDELVLETKDGTYVYRDVIEVCIEDGDLDQGRMRATIDEGSDIQRTFEVTGTLRRID